VTVPSAVNGLQEDKKGGTPGRQFFLLDVYSTLLSWRRMQILHPHCHHEERVTRRNDLEVRLGFVVLDSDVGFSTLLIKTKEKMVRVAPDSSFGCKQPLGRQCLLSS
jgi:hypothetical protein